MKTQEYFSKKIDTLKTELYAAINELAAIYKEDCEKHFIYPQNNEKISFYNENSDNFEDHGIEDVLIVKKGVYIYPKSDDFLPYELFDIINVHDLMVLKSIFDTDKLRNKHYLEVKELATICKGDDIQCLIYPKGDQITIQFLNTSSKKFGYQSIKNILISDTWIYIYPESNDFHSCNLSDITNSPDLMVLKSLIIKEMDK